MNRHLYILAILLFTFAIQANEIFACGHTSTQTVATVSEEVHDAQHCGIQSLEDDACDVCEGECNGDCGNAACHCMHSVSVPILNFSVVDARLHFNSMRNYWDKNENLPKSIHLAIWTPPQIGKILA